MAPDRKLMAVEVKATAQSFDRGRPELLFESRSSTNPGNPLTWGYVPSADGKKLPDRRCAGRTGGGGSAAHGGGELARGSEEMRLA